MFGIKPSSLNMELGDTRVEDVAEKIGSLFGEEGKQIGKAIDNLTKKITIKIETDED